MTVGIVCVPLISLLNQVLWVFSFGWLGPFPPMKLPLFSGRYAPKTTPSFMVECRGKVLFNDIVIAIHSISSRFSSLLLNRLCPVQFPTLYSIYIPTLYHHPLYHPLPRELFAATQPAFNHGGRLVGWLFGRSVSDTFC